VYMKRPLCIVEEAKWTIDVKFLFLN